jgi:hypothetical protein
MRLRLLQGLRIALICASISFVTPDTISSEEVADESDKLLGGMSIVGNDEAPKSLVIVPWKSSEMGDTLDVSRVLDDGRQPVDRDVFMRELDYYAIRSGSNDGNVRGSE